MCACVSVCTNDIRVQSGSPICSHAGEEEGGDCREYGKEMDIDGESVEKGIHGRSKVGKGVGDDQRDD